MTAAGLRKDVESTMPSPQVSCPSCGSDSASVRYRRTFRDKDWALARCNACRLQFTSPPPTDEEGGSFYAGDYHAELRAPSAAERAFGDKYHRYVAMLSRHLPSGRVVDLGCSTGLLVRLLRDRGYAAEGIELNERSAAWGRSHYGVPISTVPLEHSQYEKGSLDCIVLTDVLEHTRHPREFLRTVGDLLAPGGLALVTFPDIRSLESRYLYALARLFRRDWIWSSCHIPLHTWEFTHSTAERCFTEAGFRVVEFHRSQVELERVRSGALSLLALPLRLLRIPQLGRLFGTQMEFVIQKSADAARLHDRAHSMALDHTKPQHATPNTTAA
jgi:2-polyprenyl-3-methyl-5-hydroxy-6-metoxy-1,4-benzoquinol methylase